jgi:hypothetical protein
MGDWCAERIIASSWGSDGFIGWATSELEAVQIGDQTWMKLDGVALPPQTGSAGAKNAPFVKEFHRF